MFGGPVEYPRYPPPRPRPHIQDTDIRNPQVSLVGQHGHRSREPNTDYDKRLLHYKQRTVEVQDRLSAAHLKAVKAELTNIEHQNMAEKKRFKAKILLRLKEKMVDYETDVERRRTKLRDLLCEEERELIRETVDKHQNADVNKIEDRRKQCELVRAQNEAERLELVRQKRIQQYAARSYELRPVLAKKRLVESKDGQLQQMRDNEARRESERELDKLWLEVTKRQNEAMLERETHDALMKHERQKKDLEVLDKQVLAKKVMEEERKQIERSNREEMKMLIERIDREEKEDLRKKKEKCHQTAGDIKEQLRLQQELAERRKKEEHTLDTALRELNDLEMARALSNAEDRTMDRKRETALYREHIAQLEQLRKDEERKLDQLLAEALLDERKKVDAYHCKLAEARYKLKKQVMAGRAKQLEFNKLQAEKNLQKKMEENEAMRLFIEKNRVLDVETKRVQAEAARQYREDLKKQIEYSVTLREREMKNLEDKLKKSIEQEESYKREVTLLMDPKTFSSLYDVHPFRRVIERFDCHCPENPIEKKCM